MERADYPEMLAVLIQQIDLLKEIDDLIGSSTEERIKAVKIQLKALQESYKDGAITIEQLNHCTNLWLDYYNPPIQTLPDDSQKE